MRNHQIKSSYTKNIDDIREFMRAWPEVKYRYFIQPKTTLLEEIQILEFGPEWTDPLVTRGEADAKEVVAMGEGKSFDKYRG